MDGTIRIKDLHFLYPGAKKETLRGTNLAVDQGEFTALIGNNGCGKTSLCKTMNGLIPHFHHGKLAGEVTVCGLETTSSSAGTLAFHVGYVYQDFENQLLRPKVFDDISFAPLNFGLEDYQERAVMALELLELEDISDRYIWELSGGQKHMVALAGVLALDPSVIIVDEPIAQLDPENARHLYDRLHTLNKDQGKTIIVIEHQTDFVGKYCESVILMAEGKVLWKLPTAEALCRTEELKKHDIYPPQVTQVAVELKLSLGIPSASLYPVTIKEAEKLFGEKTHTAEVEGNRSLYAANSPPESAEFSDEVILSFEKVTHKFPMLDHSFKTVLDNITINFRKGEKVALVGSNGAGKSTMMKLIAGIIRPTEGTVIINGRNTAKSLPEELADTVSWVLQNPQEMFIEDSVKGDVAYYPKAVGLDNAEEMTELVLEQFHLGPLTERDARLLSGGQQRRASLAIGAVARPKVLLLDEPTSSLDIANRKDVLGMLGFMDAWIHTTIIATHDMELVVEWANRVIVLEEGRVIADNTPQRIFDDEDLAHRARLCPPQVIELSHIIKLRPVALTVKDFCTLYSERSYARVD